MVSSKADAIIGVEENWIFIFSICWKAILLKSILGLINVLLIPMAVSSVL